MQALPTSIVIDAPYVYWGRTSPGSGALVRANTDGTNVKVLKDYGNTNALVRVIGSFGGFLYFYRYDGTSATAGFLRCAEPDCTTQTPVADGLMTVTHGGAIDTTGSRLYYARFTSYNKAPDGTLFYAPLDGSAGPTQAITSVTEADPEELVVAGTNVYWLAAGTYASDTYQYNGAIRQAPLGTGQQTATTLTPLSSWVNLGGLSMAGSNIYVIGGNATANFDLIATTTLGATPTPLVPNTGATFQTAADSTGVFWGRHDAMQIAFCAAAGCSGTSVPLQTVGAHPVALGEDAKSIAWGLDNGVISLLAK